jgi:hypothetical protein
MDKHNQNVALYHYRLNVQVTTKWGRGFLSKPLQEKNDAAAKSSSWRVIHEEPWLQPQSVINMELDKWVERPTGEKIRYYQRLGPRL